IKLTDFDIGNIPQSMWNMAPKLFEMAYKNYLMPLIKEINQLESIVPESNGLKIPMMPIMILPMPFMSFPSFTEKNDDSNDNMMTFWDQLIDLQKSSIESSREQWDEFTDKVMEMENTFADSLPEKFPTLPGFAPLTFSPKDVMKQWQAFEEKAKEQFMDQADSFAKMYIKNQEDARDRAAKGRGKEQGSKSKSKTKSTSSKKKATVKTVKTRPVKDESES
ncbi:MAG: hypothetical protein J5813_05325, partial [Candidatus Methanomethylophilaceae archaeon]|nr:hypothetical protein [Candidatus Methanomethylophilaceae archaeon]